MSSLGAILVPPILYVNARSNGAVGDGVTDDTVALQAGIDAAAATGRPLWIPPGTYMVSRNSTNFFCLTSNRVRQYTAAAGTEVFTLASHGWVTGNGPVMVTSRFGGTLQTGLATNTNYWIIRIDANTFYLAETWDDAMAGTHLSISTNGFGCGMYCPTVRILGAGRDRTILKTVGGLDRSVRLIYSGDSNINAVDCEISDLTLDGNRDEQFAYMVLNADTDINTTNVATIIANAVAGSRDGPTDAISATRIVFIGDSAGGATGWLDETAFPSIVFHFTPATTTVANFEAHVTASTNLTIDTPSPAPATVLQAVDGFLAAVLRIALVSTNCETRVYAKGSARGLTISFVGDSVGGATGSLDEAGAPALVFHFTPSVTTVANFETKVSASANLGVYNAANHPARTLAAVVDEFPAEYLGQHLYNNEQRHGQISLCAKRLLIQRVTSKNFTADGFYIAQGTGEISEDVTYRDCLSYDNGRSGITFGGGVERPRLDCCQFMGAGSQQIDFEPAAGTYIRNGVIVGCTLDALNLAHEGYILATANARDLAVIGCTLNGPTRVGSADGIEFVSCSGLNESFRPHIQFYTDVTNAKINGGTYYTQNADLAVGDALGTIACGVDVEVMICNATIKNTNPACQGVDINSSESVVIQNCDIIGAGQPGVGNGVVVRGAHLGSAMKFVSLLGNRITDWGTAGIHIYGNTAVSPITADNTTEQFTLAGHLFETGFGPVRVIAVGTIVCDTNAAASDGDTVTVGDGSTTVIFEYDKAADGVTGGRTSWAAGTTAASNATALKLLIEAAFPTTLTVTDNLAGTLTITPVTQYAGNVPITKSGNVCSSVTAGALPTGILPATNYFAIYVSSTLFKLATTADLARAGTAQAFSTDGTGALKIDRHGQVSELNASNNVFTDTVLPPNMTTAIRLDPNGNGAIQNSTIIGNVIQGGCTIAISDYPAANWYSGSSTVLVGGTRGAAGASYSVTGTPEGAVTSAPGAIAVRRDAIGSMYRKVYGYDSTGNVICSAVNFVTNEFSTLAATPHGFASGDGPYRMSTTGGLPTAVTTFTTTTDVWVIVVSASVFKLASSRALALAGTAIDLTSAGTGVHTLLRTGWIAVPNPQYARGLVTCVAKASMADTDYVTIADGLSAPKLYEFDTAGDGVTAGRVQVNISADTTAATVAARLRTAILANQPVFTVTDNADGTLSIAHKISGTFANVDITENVANAGFLVTGMSGGVDP